MKKLVTILFLFGVVQAQTRLYFLQQPAPDTAVYQTAWNNKSSGLNFLMYSYTDNKVQANQTGLTISPPLPKRSMSAQYVTPPLAAQTLNGTIDGQMKYISNVGANGGYILIYVRQLDYYGNVKREIDSSLSTGYIISSSQTNRTMTTINLSNVSISNGDRLCVEVGWKYVAGATNLRTTTFPATSLSPRPTKDLPVDTTTNVTTLNPWIQFSQTLKWQYDYNNFF